MPKFLIISILLSPIFWACACASTDSCAEEWYKEKEEEKFLHPETCIDNEKYNACKEYYSRSLVTEGLDVSQKCYELAKYRCADRKSSSSSKSKWWH